MKAYKAFLGAAIGAGALSLLVGCEDPMGLGNDGGPQVSLYVSPASAEIGVDQIVQFTASVNGVAPTQMAQVRWSSSDPEKARIVGDGLVLGVEPGAVAIIAEYRDGSAKAQIRVRHMPDSRYGDGDNKGEKEQPKR